MVNRPNDSLVQILIDHGPQEVLLRLIDEIDNSDPFEDRTYNALVDAYLAMTDAPDA